MIRVLLVDDQPLIRTGFKTILETEPGIEVAGGDAVFRGAQRAPKEKVHKAIWVVG